MNSTVYNSKNKLRLVIIAVILLIPTALAAYFALHKDTDAVASHRLTQISVTSPYGGTITLTDEKSFELYASVIEHAALIDENFRDISADTPYSVTLTENDGVVRSYSFYMVNSSDGCIITDAEGKYYLLSEKNATSLLARSEFATVNAFAVVPNAVISGLGETPLFIAANGGSWNYRAADGSFASKELADSGERTTVKISLSAIGELSFASDTVPDSVSVTVSKDGVVKHEGEYANLLNADVMSENDTYYDLVIRAEWTQK